MKIITNIRLYFYLLRRKLKISFSLVRPLEYGETRYELDSERLNWLTDRTNRSNRQTIYLYQLLDANFEKLIQLEIKIKNCFISYCPASKDEVEKIMKMENKTDTFSIIKYEMSYGMVDVNKMLPKKEGKYIVITESTKLKTRHTLEVNYKNGSFECNNQIVKFWLEKI